MVGTVVAVVPIVLSGMLACCHATKVKCQAMASSPHPRRSEDKMNSVQMFEMQELNLLEMAATKVDCLVLKMTAVHGMSEAALVRMLLLLLL